MTTPIISKNPHKGMPPLNDQGRKVSFFEFWPAYIFYAPIFIFVVYLIIKYRGITLPSLANPSFQGGGFCGESKADILTLLDKHIPEWVANSFTFKKGEALSFESDIQKIHTLMNQHKLFYSIVVKPDLGCRGAGVRLIRNEDELRDYVQNFPSHEKMIFQRFIDYEGEAGVFYIRHPKEDKGRIFSLTLKYFPHVTGDGVSTLNDLILNDARAKQVSHLYLKRMDKYLSTIPDKDKNIRLVFSGSHSKGAIFRNGEDFITDSMIDTFDSISKRIPGFYFGRFDVRFDSIEDLKKGQNFTILEVNGAGAEATHIWDRNVTLLNAWKTLLIQYEWMYRIGFENRLQGYKPISLIDFYRLYKREKDLTPLYPYTQ